MAFEHITTETVGRVGILKFNRPEQLNTLHPAMFRETKLQLDAWNADDGIGAIVLSGQGRAFCAGAHIGRWQEQLGSEFQLTGRTNLKSGTDAAPDSAWFGWTDLVRSCKPVVAAVNGAAIGAGTTITLPADVRVASEAARFSMRFARMGLVPELGSTQLLSKVVGIGHAMELALTGRIIDAQEALRIGLVSKVVAPRELMNVATAIAAEIAFNANDTVKSIKSLMWAHLDSSDLEVVQRAERVALALAMQGSAFREAVAAFLEKRDPRFHAGSASENGARNPPTA